MNLMQDKKGGLLLSDEFYFDDKGLPEGDLPQKQTASQHFNFNVQIQKLNSTSCFTYAPCRGIG